MGNNNDALTPEIWAKESLAVLMENLIAVHLVYRDFDDEVARQGDLVNANRPGTFKAKRKTDNDSVTVQNASATNIQVKLDQHLHTSFMLKDGEESRAMKDLVAYYLNPAVLSLAQAADQIILGQWPQFLRNSAGKLGGLSSTTAKAYMLATREVMNTNKAPVANRNLVWNSSGETEALNTELFLSAEKVGDNGTSLREGSMGRKLGFNNYMSQFMSRVPDRSTVRTGAINHAGGYSENTVTFAVDGFSAAILPGSWVTIAGDMTPLQVLSTVGGATPTSITVTTPSKYAVVDNAVVTVYVPGAVNMAGGYAAGYSKEIEVDSFSVMPQVGYFLSFAPNGPVYTVIDVDGSTITLDRPLEAAIADNDPVCIGPAGSYNFAFHPNAIAFVSRPLALPRKGTGALSAVASFNDIAVRSTITYDGHEQGHLVTIDLLCGVKVLDTNLGAVLLG